MEIQFLIDSLNKLPKYEATSDYFGFVHHELDSDGFWISKNDIDEFISNLENIKNN